MRVDDDGQCNGAVATCGVSGGENSGPFGCEDHIAVMERKLIVAQGNSLGDLDGMENSQMNGDCAVASGICDKTMGDGLR